MSHQAWALVPEPGGEGGFGHGPFGHHTGGFGHGPTVYNWTPILVTAPVWSNINPPVAAWTPIGAGASAWALVHELIVGWGLQEWGTSPWGGGSPPSAWVVEDQPL
jgi:hypothetical protein